MFDTYLCMKVTSILYRCQSYINHIHVSRDLVTSTVLFVIFILCMNMTNHKSHMSIF
jgi:hypothetical protein